MKLLCITFLVFSFTSYAQQREVNLHFDAELNGETIQAGLKNQQSISMLKMYLSDILLIYSDGSVQKDKQKAHLLDWDTENTLDFSIPTEFNTTIASIEFRLGIDSLTNVSGVYGGDLDPTNGMYWSWQSGYINLKIEGEFNGNTYECHLGGYANDNRSDKMVSLRLDKAEPSIVFQLDGIVEFMNTREPKHIMSPQRDAVLLMELLSEGVKVK